MYDAATGKITVERVGNINDEGFGIDSGRIFCKTHYKING